jgi:hypothetical protein
MNVIVKKIIKYSLLSIFVISAIWNYYYSVISFIATNLSVRQSFYFTNDVNKKGTHSGGDTYANITRKHKLDLLSFNYTQVLQSYLALKHLDPQKTNFSKEYSLIQLLYDLSSLSGPYKKETAVYIPKTFDVYWNLSCDTHMPPFVAPAITNMAMIEGLPIRDQKKSCYTHFDNYGYITYRIRGIKANKIEMNHEEICQKAKSKGFVRIIEINENAEGKIFPIYHECNE